MVKTFGELVVGQIFKVGNCPYIKTDDKHAVYESAVGRMIETSFVSSNCVEVDKLIEDWEDPKKVWIDDVAQRIITAAYTNNYWELPSYD
jgi:hypothetical protein